MENKLKHKFGSEFSSMNKFIEKDNYIFSKIFWLRRKQQLDYEKYLGSKVVNANYILTNLIFFFINKFKLY